MILTSYSLICMKVWIPLIGLLGFAPGASADSFSDPSTFANPHQYRIESADFDWRDYPDRQAAVVRALCTHYGI